ncbi:MAG: hypothetical protein K2H09_00140 [Treponemataceae bacterium]|nr:hypothetical protein [Treponemataceae bacterium]
MEIPEKISIKTDAAYSFWAGNILNQDFSEYLSVKTFEDLIPPANGITPSVYDYNPGGNSSVQEYLVHFPVMEIPIDVGSYLEDMDFSTQLADMSFNQKIAIPALSGEPKEYREVLNLNKTINENLSFGNLSSFPFPGQTAETLSLEPVNVKISSASGNDDDKIEHIKYKSGSLDITLAPQDGTIPQEFETRVTATLRTAAGQESTSDEVTTHGSDPIAIKIPLDGMELSEKFQLIFEGSANGQGNEQSYIFDATAKISDDAQIEEVKNISMTLSDDAAITLHQTIDRPGDDTFVQCVISEGSLDISADLPSGYKGIELVPDIALSGGLSAENSDFEDAEGDGLLHKTLDLAGRTLENKAVSLDGTIKVLLSHADITFSDGSEDDALIIKAGLTVSRAESVTVALPDLSDKLHTEVSQEFPKDMQDHVESITLERAGIKIDYTNTLPEGNDISITAASALLNLDKGGTIAAGKTDQTAELVSDSEAVIRLADHSEIDFTADLRMPGMTDGKPELTLRNIELGKEYEISADITPVFDWKKVAIKTDGLDSIEGEIGTGINLTELFSGLTDKLGDSDFIDCIALETLPLFVYAAAPKELAAFEDISFNGEISVSAGNSEQTILDGGMNLKDLPPLIPDENGMVAARLSPDDASAYKDIAELFNNKDGDLSITYAIQIAGLDASDGSITITREEFDAVADNSGSLSTSVAVVIRLEIPLEVKITHDTYLDIKALADMDDDDLFSRSEETDISNIEEYIDVVEQAKIVYNVGDTFLKYSGNSSNMTISLNDSLLTDGGLKLELPAGRNNSEMTVQMDDLKTILKTCPFSPDVRLNFPEGTIIVPRDAKISIRLGLQVKTNGTVTVYGQ